MVGEPAVGDCVEWAGLRFRDGYGRVGSKQAHRVAWEQTYGPIPEGLFVLHRCDNRPCVNPEHLFLGTNTDNMQDMVAKGRHVNPQNAKTHCPAGHPYTGANLRIEPPGRRRCRTCVAAASRRYRQRRKEGDGEW